MCVLLLCCCRAAGITLQSGLVVDLAQLQQQYPGQCCLPRSVLADNSAVLRMDNSDGRYFVSMDPSCSSPLTSDVYPVMFEYIAVGCPAPSSSSYSSGNTYIFNGGALHGRLHGTEPSIGHKHCVVSAVSAVRLSQEGVFLCLTSYMA